MCSGPTNLLSGNPPSKMQASYGEQLLERYLALIITGTPQRQVRPDWLQGLELDFWYPDHRLAFEFQGGQHYLDRNQRGRDTAKKRLCTERGVILIRVDAADLSYPRLVRLVRYFFVFNKRAKEIDRALMAGRDIRNSLDALGRECRKYRELLTDRFGCPTARKKGSAVRKQTLRAKKGLPPT